LLYLYNSYEVTICDLKHSNTSNMGRPAKTDKQKKISGTDRSDRKRHTKISGTESVEGSSEVELNDYGIGVYNQLKEYLNYNGIFWEVDNMLISQYAYFAQIFKITADKMKDNHSSIVSIGDKGNEYMSIDYQVLANAKNQMTTLAKVLGIGPYYRQSIRAFDEEPKQTDEVADMIKEMNK